MVCIMARGVERLYMEWDYHNKMNHSYFFTVSDFCSVGY
jgi:hypothetical protein